MQQRGRPWPSSVVPYPEQLAEKRMRCLPCQQKWTHPFSLECTFAWKHHSLNHIAAVLLFNIIPAMVYYALVYTYYRQTIDPTHNACLLGRQFTSGAMTSGRRAECGYSRIEIRDRETSMTTARLEYAPTAGRALTPRQRRATQQAPYTKRATTEMNAASGPQTKRSSVSRGIIRSHRPPPLIPSPSPLGLNSTPGAPSYNRGPSRVYAAFAAPVSSEYDKFV